MAILVTGTAGFIGYHVARRLLTAGKSVIGIDEINAYYDPQLKRDRLAALRELGGDFTFHQLDFANEEALETALAGADIDRIVHLGAQAGVRYSIDNPRAYVRANLAGHLNILELARARKVAHLVYASSSSVYGARAKQPSSLSDRVDHPISLYAATKKADELMSETYAHLYRIPQTGLRFFTVYGPWGRPDMALFKFTKGILEGIPIPVYNRGEMIRDFTYIDDIVEAVIRVIDKPPESLLSDSEGAEESTGTATPYRIYNIGNNKAVPLMDYIQALEKALGCKAHLDLLPMQPGDVAATEADVSRLAADFDYRPQVQVREGISKFVEWYREYYGVPVNC